MLTQMLQQTVRNYMRQVIKVDYRSTSIQLWLWPQNLQLNSEKNFFSFIASTAQNIQHYLEFLQAKMNHFANLNKNRSNNCGDIVIFWFSRWRLSVAVVDVFRVSGPYPRVIFGL